MGRKAHRREQEEFHALASEAVDLLLHEKELLDFWNVLYRLEERDADIAIFNLCGFGASAVQVLAEAAGVSTEEAIALVRARGYGSGSRPYPSEARRRRDEKTRRKNLRRRPMSESDTATTALTGISQDPERGVSELGGLYEFWTDQDEHIYLHDTHLVSIEHRPGPPAVLTVSFLYDADWTPPELAAKPWVLFRFEDVRVDLWEEDDAAFADLSRDPEARTAPDQVSNFHWNGQDYFGLNTYLLHLSFSAQRLSVSTAATPHTGTHQ